MWAGYVPRPRRPPAGFDASGLRPGTHRASPRHPRRAAGCTATKEPGSESGTPTHAPAPLATSKATSMATSTGRAATKSRKASRIDPGHTLSPWQMHCPGGEFRGLLGVTALQGRPVRRARRNQSLCVHRAPRPRPPRDARTATPPCSPGARGDAASACRRTRPPGRSDTFGHKGRRILTRIEEFIRPRGSSDRRSRVPRETPTTHHPPPPAQVVLSRRAFSTIASSREWWAPRQ